MTDKREQTRWHLFFYLRVFEQGSGSLVGYIVDIHEQGMMLISEGPIETDKEFKLWIDVPWEDGEKKSVLLEARSLWSKMDANPDFYDSGFQLKDASPETLASIKNLIEDLKFED